MQDILKSNTPAFVFDTAALKKRVAQIKEIVGETVSLCYSMKANPFFVPAMITCVDKLEVCSPGELTICKSLGRCIQNYLFRCQQRNPGYQRSL